MFSKHPVLRLLVLPVMAMIAGMAFAAANDNTGVSIVEKDWNVEFIVTIPMQPCYVVGDANGDGQVSITDAVAIVNYILGNQSLNFDFKAADVNNDSKITITDAVGVVNIILNQVQN